MDKKRVFGLPQNTWCGDEVMDTNFVREAIKKARHRFSVPTLLLRAAGGDHELRMKMLEFIDVLPALNSSKEICERFIMLIAPHRHKLPFFLKYGSFFPAFPLCRGISAYTIQWLVYKKLAPHFIVTGKQALASLQDIYLKEGARMSIDFLGELVTSDREAEHFLELYCRAIRAHKKEDEPFHMSVKLSSLYPFFGPENHDESKRVVSIALGKILECAQEHNAFVTIDAEQYAVRHLVEDIFCDTISDKRFAGMKHVGIALQAYRTDALFSASRFVAVARSRGTPFTIRLVKGAYWDTEIAFAEQNSWPAPLFVKKSETDEHFKRVFAFLASHWGIVYVSPATHNPENIAHAYNLMKALGRFPDKHFTFQVLYGLGEPVRKALCRMRLPVLVYTPVGAIEGGMAYFARRILENTSNEGFLFELLGKEE